MKFESKLLTVCMLGLAAALPTLRDPEPSQSSLSAASAQGPDAVGSFVLQRWGGDAKSFPSPWRFRRCVGA